jgi:hypothetical protein
MIDALTLHLTGWFGGTTVADLAVLLLAAT